MVAMVVMALSPNHVGNDDDGASLNMAVLVFSQPQMEGVVSSEMPNLRIYILKSSEAALDQQTKQLKFIAFKTIFRLFLPFTW